LRGKVTPIASDCLVDKPTQTRRLGSELQHAFELQAREHLTRPTAGIEGLIKKVRPEE
jgi:hypothetical protein